MSMQPNWSPGGTYAQNQPGAWWNNPYGGGITPSGPDFDNNNRNPYAPDYGNQSGGGKKKAKPAPQAAFTPQAVAALSANPAISNNQQPQQRQMAPLSSYLSQVPPINLPTKESQNQLLALGSQNASMMPLMDRMVGNNGVQAGSGVNMMRMANPMQAAYRTGAQGAAQIGLEDQLARDKHLLAGMIGLGGADFGLQRANLGYNQIGIDSQNNNINALLSLLGGMGGAFGGV